jgi:L-lactate dehydrogenase complex protein LldG
MTPENEKYLGYLKKILNPSAPADRKKEPISICKADPAVTDPVVTRVRQRDQDARKALLKRFRDESKNLFQRVRVVQDTAEAGAALVELIRKIATTAGPGQVIAWDTPLIRALGLEKSFTEYGISFSHPQFNPDRRQPEQERISAALAGITTADYALAETGTLALQARPDQPRAVFLLPPVHIAVLRIEQLILNLAELYALLRADNSIGGKGSNPGLTLLSGVSRTGDIEAVPILGAHGPKEVYIYIIRER